MLDVKEYLLVDVWEKKLQSAHSIIATFEDGMIAHSWEREYNYNDFINLSNEELIKISVIYLLNEKWEVTNAFAANTEWDPDLDEENDYIPYWIELDTI